MARFWVNFISDGRLYKAGEEVPETVVPAYVRKYALPAAGNGSASEPEPVRQEASARKSRRIYVRRGPAFKPIDNELPVAGERIYTRKPGSNAFVRVGRVKSVEAQADAV